MTQVWIVGLSGGAETCVSAVSPMAKRAGIILDGPIVEKLRFLRMGIIVYVQRNYRTGMMGYCHL